MKKRLIFTGLLALLFAACCFAQKPYKVVFYNLENFFDTINDPEVNDDEFTPEGPKKWNSVKYAKKLGNTEKVLFDIAGIDKDYPIVIGVSEVENRSVLEDIIATPKMAPGNYRISHYDSPEARGVDVAFMYRPDVFKLEGSAPIRTQIPSLPNFKTRDISTMWGTIDGEPFFFMVAHWPSRLGGKDASEFKRIAVGEQMRRIADSVLKVNPATKIVAMGDFNDDPTDAGLFGGGGGCPQPGGEGGRAGGCQALDEGASAGRFLQSVPRRAACRYGNAGLRRRLESLRQYRSVGKPGQCEARRVASGAGSGIEVLRECLQA